ncbi:MAG: hypothetical protein JW727_04290 [Candidatus Aenigmarchaeota archaeon]|nr:hypothetical protein [Candidatus Aenigmarchaeota archaeon]
MIGWIIFMAIFVLFAMFYFGFIVQFNTIPREPVEKYTACDIAFMISLWDKATVKPNIFDEDFLRSWNSENSDGLSKSDTSDIIFEKLSRDFFIPDSDIYLEMTSEGEDPYRLYLPKESASVFTTCARPTYTSTDPSTIVVDENGEEETSGGGQLPRTSRYLRSFFGTGDYYEEGGDGGEYAKDMTSYNAILAQCQLPTFVKGADVRPAELKVSTTTNLATRLRDGIYRVGVLGQAEAYYPLGSYPEGCIVNEGATEVSESVYSKTVEAYKRFLVSFFDFFGVGRRVWWESKKVYASCGFNWGFERTEVDDPAYGTGNMMGLNVLSVYRKNNGEECPLVTRIPDYIYTEGQLSEKLCSPKTASVRTWLPGYSKDLLGRYQYYLKVESARKSWTATNEMEFCKLRCNEGGPWWFLKKNVQDCEISCEYLTKPSGEYTCDNIYSHWACKLPGPGGFMVDVNTASECLEKDKLPRKDACEFAKSMIDLYRNLPEDAIDVRYIVVESSKLVDRGFSDLSESDYYASASACAGWNAVGECDNSRQCTGLSCVAHKCSTCSKDAWGFCSPWYLEDVPVDSGLFLCQNAYDAIYPSNKRMSECLPNIRVNVSRVLYDSSGDVSYDEIFPRELKIPGEWRLDLGTDIAVIGNTELSTFERNQLLKRMDDPAERAVLETPEISCSAAGNENLVLNWTINASGLCCPEFEEKEIEIPSSTLLGSPTIKKVEVCTTPPEYCQNMKFWPNLDSGNVVEMVPGQHFYEDNGVLERVITGDDYVFEVTQQVCREGNPYNNAPSVFITAAYVVKDSSDPSNVVDKTLLYSMRGSEVAFVE